MLIDVLQQWYALIESRLADAGEALKGGRRGLSRSAHGWGKNDLIPSVPFSYARARTSQQAASTRTRSPSMNGANAASAWWRSGGAASGIARRPAQRPSWPT
jgi:hypothetical protein